MLKSGLEFRQVSKSYKQGFFNKVNVLNSISFKAEEGQCTAIVGHNGAGKSTTLRLLLGLTQLRHGEITWRGQATCARIWNRFGYMPELNKVHSESLLIDWLRSQLKLYGVMSLYERELPQSVEMLIQRFHLESYLKFQMKNLSSGTLRKLMWIAAIAHDPELLILDEPFSGLDPYARYELEEMIYAEKKSGRTILLSTHELDMVRKLCDELIVLNSGEVVYRSIDDEQPKEYFHLELVGVSADEVTKHTTELNKPDLFEHKGAALFLSFTEREKALGWLKLAMQENWPISCFEDSFSPREPQVKEWLRKKEVAS